MCNCRTEVAKRRGEEYMKFSAELHLQNAKYQQKMLYINNSIESDYALMINGCSFTFTANYLIR